MKKGLIIVILLFIVIFVLFLLTARKEKYAAPRDENTQPPFVEPATSNVDDQTQIYKDMAGLDFQIQAGNPILNFIQGDPTSNTIYGDFVPHESLSGNAPMYSIDTEGTSNVVPDNGIYLPETTSPVIPFVGESSSNVSV
jgi:hypothetical protein